MFILFMVLIVITCILTILIVLVQNSKGGGLATNFSSSNQYMGVRKTGDFLEKATWSLGTALILFCLLAGVTIPSGTEEESSRLSGQFDQSRMEQPATTIDLPESFDTEPAGEDGN
jgi:preprotein translocase subunit SecG